MFKIFNYILIFFLSSLNIALAESVNVFEFTEDELSTLKVRKVRGADSKTQYSLGSNEKVALSIGLTTFNAFIIVFPRKY